MRENGRRSVRSGAWVVVVAALAAASSVSCSWKSAAVNGATDTASEIGGPPSQDARPDTPPEASPDTASDASADRAGDVGPDSSADLRPDMLGDRAEVEAGRCTRSLSEVSGGACPASYDLIGDRACMFVSVDGGTSTSTCGAFMIFAARGFFDTYVCYYDATSRALVAASQCTDYNAYCGGTDYCYWAGAPVGACEVSNFTLAGLSSSICPDGGSSDSTSPG